MKAIAIRPTVMNVMPSPRNGRGTSEYASFSRMAPSRQMASVHPMPEPTAKARASARPPIYCELEGSRLMRCCMKSDAPMMAQLTAMSGRKMPRAA